MSQTLKFPGLAIIGTLALGGAAHGADLYSPPPVSDPIYSPEPAFSWTGFYVGLHGGGGWGDSEATFQDGDPSIADFDIDGPYVGGQIGANWQINSLVLGVEADASWSGIDGIRQVPNFQTTHDIDWFATVRGRVGWAMGNWMPYLTAGWAYAEGTRHHLDTFLFPGGVSASGDHSGWTAGGGVEWAITNNWSVKGEYKYIDFGSGDYNYTGDNDTDVSVDLTVHTFEVGLNYKF